MREDRVAVDPLLRRHEGRPAAVVIRLDAAVDRLVAVVDRLGGITVGGPSASDGPQGEREARNAYKELLGRSALISSVSLREERIETPECERPSRRIRVPHPLGC
jgi:hypothetical protein